MFPPGTIEAFGLYLVRTSALVLGSPILGTGAMFAGYKVALIGAISVLLFSVSGTPIDGSVEPVRYGLFVLREVMIGLSLAFVLQLVVLAVRVSSDMIGHEMGFAMASEVDPVQGFRTPLITHFYETFFFMAVLAVNGHHWMIRALAESYERAPIASIEFEAGMPEFIVGLFGQLFAAGLTFAAPVLVILTLVSAMIGLLSRAVPQLNILEIGFNLRITAGLAAMLLFVPVIVPAMNGLLELLMDGLTAGLDVLGT
jgi:flagellar biosynthetic protein FliR